MENAGEYYEANRLQAFSDAVCSIVATILILPLRNVTKSSNEHFPDYLKGREDLIIVYFLAFLLICSVWESHIIRWIVISYVDDVLVWLNIISLLFISFLPFVVRLVSDYPHKKTPIVLSCCLLLVLELIEMAMVAYTFFRQKLLRWDLINLLPSELKQKRNYILKRRVLNIALYICAAALGYVNLTISWILIVLVIVSPCINRLFEVIVHKMNFSAETQHISLYNNIISKERVECFSDGVYAIVATLLILDITSEDFPTPREVQQNGMEKALVDMWPKYITYVGTFTVCGLLWFVHHSLFHSMKKVNYAMLIINNISLSCVGSLPFLTSLLNKYAEKPQEVDRYAIQFGSLIVGVAGLCQFAIFTLALWNSSQYVPHHLIPVGVGLSRHNYLIIKLLLIPLVAIIIFCSSFANQSVIFATYHTLVLITPVLFILVKLIYFRIFKDQVAIMNVVDHENQPAWSTRNIHVASTQERPSGETFSPAYDQYS